MPLENIPWAVLDGITSASTARMLAYQATGGEEGVAGLGDMLVRQTAVASGSVRIAAGGAIMVNRYPGVKNESYMGRAGDETVIAVAPNAGTLSRTDMLICYIDDWNFAGQQPTPGTLPTNSVPVTKFKIISGVNPSFTKATQLGLAYPAIALARITIPPATSAITQGMITSLREKAVPRRRRLLNAKNLSTGRCDKLDFNGATGEQFPDDASWTIEIPDWATEARVVMTWGAVKYPGGSASGYVWGRIGVGRPDAFNTQSIIYDSDGTANSQRDTMVAGDTIKIPSTMRGQSVVIALMGKYVTGTAATHMVADERTSVIFDLEFLEASSEDV